MFDADVTTVSTYLMQGVFGLGVTIIAAMLVTDLFSASGVILPFGYGQACADLDHFAGILRCDEHYPLLRPNLQAEEKN